MAEQPSFGPPAPTEAGGMPVQPIWDVDPYQLGGQFQAQGEPSPYKYDPALGFTPAQPGMRWETGPEYRERLLRAMTHPDYVSNHPGTGNHIQTIQVPLDWRGPAHLRGGRP